MTHLELCIKGAKFLRSKGIQPFNKCQYSVCELERLGESPDAFGWSSNASQLIESKISRSDFLADKKKYWRKNPHLGLGNFRSYLCPDGLILSDELPKFWGLLYCDDKGKIKQIVQPQYQESNKIEEINLITSLFRRENIKPQMFSYKNYKSI